MHIHRHGRNYFRSNDNSRLVRWLHTTFRPSSPLHFVVSNFLRHVKSALCQNNFFFWFCFDVKSSNEIFYAEEGVRRQFFFLYSRQLQRAGKGEEEIIGQWLPEESLGRKTALWSLIRRPMSSFNAPLGCFLVIRRRDCRGFQDALGLMCEHRCILMPGDKWA
jgi:hypothetical protein